MGSFSFSNGENSRVGNFFNFILSFKQCLLLLSVVPPQSSTVHSHNASEKMHCKAKLFLAQEDFPVRLTRNYSNYQCFFV